MKDESSSLNRVCTRSVVVGLLARTLVVTSQEPPPQEDEDEESSEDEQATGAEAAQKSKSGAKQASESALDRDKSTLETSVPGLTQQNTSFPAAPFPYPQFPMPNMPNMPNPYGIQAPFGQTQQPQATPYQQTADQQRQYFASMAAWNNMMTGGQQVPFPGMPGMPVQPPGGAQAQGGSQMQGGTSFPPGPGTGSG